MSTIACFYACITTAGLLLPLVALSILSVLLFVAFRMDNGFRPLLGAQMTMTAAISLSLASMTCYMSTWLWAYLGLLLVGSAILLALRMSANKRLRKDALGTFPALADLELEFGFPIVVLGTQRVRAVAHRGRVYLSMGLLELLDDDELRAVIAHEVYHLRKGPSRLVGHLLALTSLTFLRFEDDLAADAYAADVVGEDAIIRALENLGIQDRKKRSLNLHSGS
jgi:heat shock protein HtpX